MTNATKSRRRILTAPRFNKLRFFEDIDYEPHEGQLAVHRSTAPRRVLVCGVRWGKTRCGAMEALAAAMQPAEESLGWLVGPSYELAGRVFSEVRRVVEARLTHHIVQLKPNSRRLVLRNLGGGLSEIRCKSADRPDSLLGEGVDWIVVDEASRLSDVIWAGHLSQRLLDRDGWALLMSTPRGAGWLHDMYRRGGVDPRYESWRRPSWTNPHLPKAAIAQERERLASAVFDQEYGAVFLDVNNRPICSRCEPPDPPRGIILLAEDEELELCPECERPIDRDGTPLGYLAPDGEVYLKALRLTAEIVEQERTMSYVVAAPHHSDNGTE